MESQSTPVIRRAPCLPLADFPRALDCRDPSPDRQVGARGTPEGGGIVLPLLRLPDAPRPQPLHATVGRSAVAGTCCRNPASRQAVPLRRSAMPPADLHRAVAGNGAAESEAHIPPRRNPTGDGLYGRRRARLLPVAQTGHAVSGDTLLRMIRAAGFEPPEAPRVVGIDDWAWRKGLCSSPRIFGLLTRHFWTAALF